MATPTKWTPTENMEAALKYATEKEWDFVIVNLCTAIGICRQSYYDWFETAAFEAWWGKQWERYFAVRMRRIWMASAARAEGQDGAKGNTHDAKLLAERFDKGYAPKTRQEVKADATLKTYINVDVPRVAGQEEAESDQEGGDGEDDSM